MRNSRTSADHEEAVRRRLALLGAELQSVRAPDTHTRIPADRLAVAPAYAEDSPPTIRPGEARSWATLTTEAPPTRVRPLSRDHVVAASEDPAPPAVFVPEVGRHAIRRSASAPMPAALRGAVARQLLMVGPGQLAVIALALVVALALLCVWLIRREPAEVVAPVSSPISLTTAADPGGGAPAQAVAGPGTATSSGHSAAGQGAAAEAELVVHVAGKVRKPGIAVLPTGSRVADALEAAGGARSGVDLSQLNLARPLVDGEQILVGERPPQGVVGQALATHGSSAGADGAPAAGALVNLNTAGQAELEALPEVGPVTAQSILGWREEHGGFSSVDELLEVDGIGEATLAQLAPLVTL